MAKRLETLTVASNEALAAFRWYFERDAAAAAGFESELRAAFAAIERVPETWPPHIHGTRRFLLRRFPYEVVYRVLPEVVLIVAVAHFRRRPGYWAGR